MMVSFTLFAGLIASTALLERGQVAAAALANTTVANAAATPSSDAGPPYDYYYTCEDKFDLRSPYCTLTAKICVSKCSCNVDGDVDCDAYQSCTGKTVLNDCSTHGDCYCAITT